MKPDIIIEIRFKTEEEGGRKNAINAIFYGCPLFVDGMGFDCRLLINGKIELGKKYEVPVKFLRADIVLPRIFPGKLITLWEGKEIATGKILKILK